MPTLSRRSTTVGMLLLLSGATTGVLLPSAPVRACGGFFCNPPDPLFDPLPVAQTAENVLFAMERDPYGQFRLEAHVQIFYTGPADKFSWVVPVDSLPEIDVGSNAVFTALLGATRPSFGLNWQTVGTCKELPVGADAGARGPSSGAGGSSATAPGSSADPGVSVAFRGDVGPYDAAVIKSNDPNNPKPLLDWLEENKYFVTPDGARLIAEYVKENKHFVAIRLLSQAGVNEIQPLVMRFVGPGPCVPIRLTSIASIKDLRVNLWVLAEHRVVPDNYYEIVLNEARIDWFRSGANYEDLVKSAANEAGGNAFTTEFVGPPGPLSRAIYQPERFDLRLVRAARTPPEAMGALSAFPRDAALLNVLRTHIPVPMVLVQMGVSEQIFYNQLASYWQQFQADFKPFSAEAFANDLDKKIVQPLAKASALFDKHPKLTRLATFISPEEMNVDPTFVMNPSLPDVPARRTATAYRVCGDRQYNVCEAPVRLELRDGQAVWFRPRPQPVCYGAPFDYERAKLDEMPALAVGYARTAAGEGLKKFDKEAEIRARLSEHNAAVSAQMPVPPSPGTGGRGGAPGWNPPPTTSSGQTASGGCGCQLPGGPGSGLSVGLAVAIVGAGLVLRRRRRRPDQQD